MKLQDLDGVIDKSMPIWINVWGFSDRYENYDKVINGGYYYFYEDDSIKYMTVNADGELVIEL